MIHRMQSFFRVSLLLTAVFFLTNPPGARAEAARTVEAILAVAHEYMQTVRKWEPETYRLQVKGKGGENEYRVRGVMLEEVARNEELKRKHTGQLSGTCPSEFLLIIDMNTKTVVKDIRLDSQEFHPRP